MTRPSSDVAERPPYAIKDGPMAFAFALAMAFAIPMPTSAQGRSAVEGEGAAGLSQPEPGQRPHRRGEREPSDDDGPETSWHGPRVELGYTHYTLVDGHGGGGVHGAFFGGYLPTGSLRIGGAAELGLRNYALGEDDLLLRGTVLVGYQHLGFAPLLPYAGATASIGVLFGKRFRTPVSSAIGGFGLRVGVDVNIVRNLFAGLSLSYARASMQDLGFDIYSLELRVGL